MKKRKENDKHSPLWLFPMHSFCRVSFGRLRGSYYYNVDTVMRKYTPFNIYNILTSAAVWAIIILVFTQCACGAAATTPSQLGSVSTETSNVQIPVKVEISDPTEAAPVWITTGALNVRAEANADSEILGTLAPLTEIQIYITDISGDDCYLGEWYAITSPIEGYVCSLWVVRK